MTRRLALGAGGFAAPEGFADFAFQYLSSSRFRQWAFYELYQAGHFVFGNARLERQQQLLFGQWLGGVQDNDGHRNLPPLRIGGGNHGAFEDGRVGEDSFLYLDRRNVFATADDDILLA